MLICNLEVVLAERGLRITKVSRETGISRTTLTDLAKNRAQGVQLDTLNTLCVYLKASPADVFPALPYDIWVKNAWAEADDDNAGKFDIVGGFSLEVCDGVTSGKVIISFDTVLTEEDLSVCYIYPSYEDASSESIETLKQYYFSLPIPFRRVLAQRIEYQISRELPTNVDEVRLNDGLDTLLQGPGL